MMQLLVSFIFYIKKYLFVWFFIIHINLVDNNFFFFVFIKFDKQVDMIDPFNKWVVLELKNLNPFNKHVGLVLTYIVGYS